MSSIDEIVSHISKNYFTKPNRYSVRIMGNSGDTIVGDAGSSVMFNCSQVNIPGLNVGVNQHRKHGIGVPTSVPSSKNFTECTLTFYESEKMGERAYFSGWVSNIMSSKDGRLQYFDKIKKNIKITQYDTKGNVTYECTLNECFPTNVSPSDRAYSASDTIPQFVVSFQFRSMEEIYK